VAQLTLSPTQQQARPIFSRIEQRVLDIAWRDSRRVPLLGQPIFRKLGRLFGLPEQLPLADKRLEALRSYALRALRCAGLVSSRDDEALIENGFSHEQLTTLRIALKVRRDMVGQ
jgi:hypothetical protein